MFHILKKDGLIRTEKAFKGRFTLWLKVKRLSIPTNYIARNQEFSLLTLHIRGQSPKVVALQTAYMAILLTTEMDSQMKFGSHRNENPNFGREIVDLFALNN
jgi:hypothetical protein